MATDPSSLDETDGATEDNRADPALSRNPGPPRPPRPGKRSKGSGRVPIPLPQNRAEIGPIDIPSSSSAANDAAPSVDIDAAERDDPAFPLRTPRHVPNSWDPQAKKISGSWDPQAKKISGSWDPQPTRPDAPEQAFHDAGADVEADHAPNAPVTPWHNLPSLEPEMGNITPARAAPISFDRDESDSQPEPTIVGKVPENLLELSVVHEENTRAFTAPRELLELARRKREDRDPERSAAREGRPLESSAAPGEEYGRDTARAPGGAGGAEESTSAPSVPIDSVIPLRSDPDAAPPVARTISGEMEAVALPSRRRASSEPPAPSGPDIEIDPVSDPSPPAEPAVGFVPQQESDARSEALPSGLRKSTSTFVWMVAVALFVIVGIAITRWPDVAALFH